jgi:hypothetical protein
VDGRLSYTGGNNNNNAKGVISSSKPNGIAPSTLGLNSQCLRELFSCDGKTYSSQRDDTLHFGLALSRIHYIPTDRCYESQEKPIYVCIYPRTANHLYETIIQKTFLVDTAHRTGILFYSGPFKHIRKRLFSAAAAHKSMYHPMDNHFL